jgi:hypothetical protein
MGGGERVGRAELAALIGAAATSSADGKRMVRRLVERCWPGGADRTIPPARVWLRGWGATRMSMPTHDCVCHRGRCPLCN